MSITQRFVMFCLKQRYDVVVEGEDIIKKYKDASLLFLANHPATIDPVIVLTHLYPYIKLQPLAAAKFFKSPFIHYFLKKMKALPVPEFDKSTNEYKAFQVKKLTEQLREALQKKAKVLLYPAGHLSDSSYEKIGGASMAFDLRNEPKKLIGIATDGLYGSIFSRYFEGKTPPFSKMLKQGIKIALLNGIFFLPKRKVTIRIFEIDDQVQKIEDRFIFNQQLEKQFNSLISHKPNVISYGFCKTPTKKLQKEKNEEEYADPKIIHDLLDIVEKVTKKKISPEAHFSYDLGIDSLELAEILAIVEQKYHLRIEEMPQSLKDLAVVISNVDVNHITEASKLKDRQFMHIELPESQNLLQAFYKQAKRNYSSRMGADLTLGEMSYKKAFLAVELLSSQIKLMQGQYIGILLPSSIMAYVLMLSVLKAGKKPVMINWTSGRKSNDFACDLLKIKHIISSEKFLDKAYNIDLGDNFEKVVVLEDIKKKINLFSKLKALTRFYIPALLRLPDIQKNDVACVLFTSGSEAMPKAVPLSHENILANITSLLKTNLIKDNDRFLATLPPFHSFGCVVSGFLPIICGLDTVYLPDPTDAVAIAAAFKQFQATLFCSAPSFMKQILIYSEKGQLDSLRLAVVGAEKLQDSTKELFQKICPKACLLEGYGITECSPVVTIQKNVMTQGVGIPIQDVKLLVVDPESLTPLPQGHVGEILVHGKNVFSGYLGINKDPFVEIDSKKWYRTGDRGSLSPKNELILEGRYKRFVKIGGEMVSLSALEETLEDYRKNSGELAQFAVVADSSHEKLILATIHLSLNLDDVNQFLRQKGLPKVAKFAKIVTVKMIPQLATGKIDYRKLENEVI